MEEFSLFFFFFFPSRSILGLCSLQCKIKKKNKINKKLLGTSWGLSIVCSTKQSPVACSLSRGGRREHERCQDNAQPLCGHLPCRASCGWDFGRICQHVKTALRDRRDIRRHGNVLLHLHVGRPEEKNYATISVNSASWHFLNKIFGLRCQKTAHSQY